MSFVTAISESTGINEAALRLLLCILFAYPLAFVYRIAFPPTNTNTTAKHIYNLVCGFALAWFCYGYEVYHSVITILVTYAILAAFSKSRSVALVLAFHFNIGYLVTAYYFMSSVDKYDIDWTTAQSVLCLRLVGLAFDYYDGGRKDSKDIEADQKENGLVTLPPLLEVFSFCYYYTSFFIGPQFTFKRYQQFITGEIFNSKDKKVYPSPYKATLRCVLLGIVYLAVNNIASGYFYSSKLLTEEWQSQSFVKRLLVHFITCYIILSKYLGIWLLGEGSSVLSGIGFKGWEKDGCANWTGLSNVNPLLYETSPNLAGVVGAFNINTNDWAKRYIFKRLKFLNNRNVSFMATTLFLALWHGLAPGYFICFILEFFSLDAERRLQKMTQPLHEKLAKSPVTALVDHIISQFLRMATTYFAFISFEVKTVDRTLTIWKGLYYWFFIAYVIVFIADVLKLGPLIFGKPKRTENAKKEE